MRARRIAVSCMLALAAGCGDNWATIPGPYEALPLEGNFTESSLSAPVHVARDRYGIAHINAQSVGDGGFVQGYVTAHDRLPQMDLLRRAGAGTLAELFGVSDPSVIDRDLAMRVHRPTYYAQLAWAQMQASGDPRDAQLVVLLERYADGVNAYAADLAAGRWTLDPALADLFAPTRFVAWTPIDSLVVLRAQALGSSWSAPFEIASTELYQKLRATFDDSPPSATAAHARRGISRDLMAIAPVAKVSTIDGFPNVGSDTGSRADAADLAPIARPVVPQAVFDAARAFLAADPHVFAQPPVGANSWAVAPARAGGVALLATDQHLPLVNPSSFYPVHLIIHDVADVEGVTIPGVPGIVLGTNGDLAWAGTASEHDANDVYLETIAGCGSAGASCVTFDGAQVPIETFTETVQIGTLGAITGSQTATYEVVPQHGPILPTIANHAIVPRTQASALSVRYTGDAPTFELRALWDLARSHTVRDGFASLATITDGGQNWTMIDNAGGIGWSTNADVPLRDPAAYTWDPLTHQDGLAPFMVLPGDGTAEWQGRMDARYMPAAIDPPAGVLVTANADPVGATFDNAGLHAPMVDGRPLYVGVAYAAGLREERISTLVAAAAAAGPVTADDLARIQRDTHSNVGAKLVPPILTALARLDTPEPNPTDVGPYVAALSAADRQRLETAKALLAGWSFETPPAGDGSASQADLTDSAATAVFNAWMHYFCMRVLGDELAAMDLDPFALADAQLVRIVYKLLVEPATFVTSPATQQPVLCDDMTSASDDSCTVQILAATLDAMTYLETSDGFGTADVTAWRWGKLHRLTIAPMVPGAAPGLGSFATAGDNFAIDRADPGWSDTDFAQLPAGPAQRFVASATPGQPIAVRWALPGGTIFDSRDPHDRDLLDAYWLPLAQFDAAYTTADILAAGESRWELHP